MGLSSEKDQESRERTGVTVGQDRRAEPIITVPHAPGPEIPALQTAAQPSSVHV